MMTKKQIIQFKKNHSKLHRLYLENKITKEGAIKGENFLCRYPDWEGGIIKAYHLIGKDGFCIICGEKINRKEKK